MDMYIPSFDNFVPISLNLGPKSIPSLLTRWHIVHEFVKTTFPFTASPDILINSAIPGCAFLVSV